MKYTFLCVPLLVVTLAVLSLLGCASPDPLDQAARAALGSVEVGRAFEAAETVMRAEFGAIQADRERRAIDVAPQRVATDTLAIHQGPMRRTAQMRLRQEGQLVWAYLMITLQRQDTQTYQAFGYQRSGSETGVSSPMESARTTPEARRTVWTEVGRQRDVERAVLSRLREALAAASDGDAE